MAKANTEMRCEPLQESTTTEDGGSRCRALVVDDDQYVRQEVVHSLLAAGFDCSGVGNGRWALASLQDYPETSVVIVDLRMPEMDGLQLMSAIDDHFATIIQPALIVLSGHLDKNSAKAAVSEGATDCLQKPISRQELLDSVNFAADQVRVKRTALRNRETLRNLVGDMEDLLEQTSSRLADDPLRSRSELEKSSGGVESVQGLQERAAVKVRLARLLRERESRRNFFPLTSKAEHGWEMLLELALNHFGNRITYLSSLAVGSRLPVSTCSRHLEGLEEKGLAQRSPDPVDKRRVRITLTELGEAKVRDYLASLE